LDNFLSIEQLLDDLHDFRCLRAELTNNSPEVHATFIVDSELMILRNQFTIEGCAQ
jgi:hypothetical protein